MLHIFPSHWVPLNLKTEVLRFKNKWNEHGQARKLHGTETRYYYKNWIEHLYFNRSVTVFHTEMFSSYTQIKM